MLENNAEAREVFMEFSQMRQKGWLRIYYMDVLYQV